MRVMDYQVGTDPSLNSLGSKFSSQSHFHSLELVNVPQFLFCGVVGLKTAPRGNFSDPQQIHDHNHTNQLKRRAIKSL